MKAKKIEVHWEDHHEIDGNSEPTDPENLRPVIWETRGYLLTENEHMLEVAREITRTPQAYPAGATVRIMKKCIVYRSDKKGA